MLLGQRLRGDLQGIFEFPTIFSVSTATRYARLESRLFGTFGYTRDLVMNMISFRSDSPSLSAYRDVILPWLSHLIPDHPAHTLVSFIQPLNALAVEAEPFELELLVPSVFLNIVCSAQNCKADPTPLTLSLEVPLTAKSLVADDSGAVHCVQGYVSGEEEADSVKSSRQVARLYVGGLADFDVAAGAEDEDELLSVELDTSSSLDEAEAGCRFANNETQTPTTTEQMMRMPRAIKI
jgi:hypothetical protein